jgi:large subunit ribosomal protein L11
MAKKIKTFVKLALIAGKATPAPPVGPVLGQHGINIVSFCKEYNAKTQDFSGLIIPVKITIFDDRSFTFILKSSPASALLKKYANVKKGSAMPQTTSIGSITKQQLKEIALIKLEDLNTQKLSSAMSIITGTAKNMGIAITE